MILSDRSVGPDMLPIPALLATAAVHEHLVKMGLRTSTGLVVETGSAREVHHFALLAGYGAEAIHPYLALETLAHLQREVPASAPRTRRSISVKAIGKGLMKVMSKMGISTYQSYCGAQIFEAVGLQKAFVDKYFGHGEQRRGHRPVRSGRGSRAAARARVRRRPAARGDAGRRRRVPVPDRQTTALDAS